MIGRSRIFWLLLLVMSVKSISSAAQYAGGTGRGDHMQESPVVIIYSIYSGGSGRGDQSAQKTNTSLFSIWETMENNRVVVWNHVNEARALRRFNSTGTMPEGLQAPTRSMLNLYSVTPLQNGLHASAVEKPNNQLLIRGDFRSMRINPSGGQSACATQGSYSQLLWLNTDQLQLNVTKCYTDKTLSTLYALGDGTSWYNISGGGAVRINSSGTIVGISCY